MAFEPLLDDTDALQAMPTEMRTQLSRAKGSIVHLKRVNAKMKRELLGPRFQRTQVLLDQLELQLKEPDVATTEDETRRAPLSSNRRASHRSRYTATSPLIRIGA